MSQKQQIQQHFALAGFAAAELRSSEKQWDFWTQTAAACLIILLILADHCHGPSCCCRPVKLSSLCTAANESHLTRDLIGISLSVRPGTAAVIFLSPCCMHKGWWIHPCSSHYGLRAVAAPEGQRFGVISAAIAFFHPPCMDGAPAFCCSPTPVGRGGETSHLMVSTLLTTVLKFCTLSVVR